MVRRLLPLLLLFAPAAASAQRDTLIAPRAKGLATAPVTVYEMSDLQCPFCRRFAVETFPTIEKEYIKTGKVRWVFVHLPLTQIHQNAASAAIFATCAMKQGKFWPTHDALYAQQEKWEKLTDPAAFFLSLAGGLGMQRAPLNACLASPDAARIVRSDAAGAIRAGAKSTPTFFIEGGIMEGAHPIEAFRHVLDSVVAAKTAKPAKAGK
jgi:protein-disulfide isomerase